jgi:type II secretory pathway component PulF
MFKLLSQQGLTMYESIREMPLFVDSKDRVIFLNMRELVLEGKPHEEIIRPLKHKLESWIFKMLLMSHMLVSPSQYYDALITMIEDKHVLFLQQQKAKRYPMLVFVLAMVVLVAYVYVILPTYMTIFTNMGQQSELSMWLIEKSLDIRFIFSFLLAIVLMYGIITSVFKKIKHDLLFKKKQNGVKYFYFYDILMKMSVYSEQHMTFFEMFDMLYKQETIIKMKQTYQHIVSQLQLGEDLYEILRAISFIPKEIQMIVPLTTLNNRQQTLTHLSNHYKVQYVERTERLQSLIEPMLLLLLGVLILFIGYLMYQPILEFYDSIGSQI